MPNVASRSFASKKREIKLVSVFDSTSPESTRACLSVREALLALAASLALAAAAATRRLASGTRPPYPALRPVCRVLITIRTRARCPRAHRCKQTAPRLSAATGGQPSSRMAIRSAGRLCTKWLFQSGLWREERSSERMYLRDSSSDSCAPAIAPRRARASGQQ
eukprot:scaffold85928_cov37-Tisochrysis_lutea.AAC.5